MRYGTYEVVGCDGQGCGEELEVSLDWDEAMQAVDDSDEAVAEKLRYAGWVISDTDDDTHYCSKRCASK